MQQKFEAPKDSQSIFWWSTVSKGFRMPQRLRHPQTFVVIELFIRINFEMLNSFQAWTKKMNNSWALSILYQISSIEVCTKTMKIVGGWPDCGLTVSIAVLLFLVGSTTGGPNLPKQIEDVRLEQDSRRTLGCTTVLHNDCAGHAPTTQLL